MEGYWNRNGGQKRMKRIIWKGRDFAKKTAEIEKRKLGKNWHIDVSPYESGRFIVFKYESQAPQTSNGGIDEAI
jgi:hypothetical protein